MEHFRNDEDANFRVHSTKQMLNILQHVAEQGSRLALYYDNLDNFIVTTLLAADEKSMHLEPSQDASINQLILLGNALTVVGLYREVKMQFTVKKIQRAMFDNSEVFCLTMPDYLLRIQRREFFRLAIPASTPIQIDIPIKSNDPDEPPVIRKVPLMNISGGGVALLCERYESELLPGKTFEHCHISLPDIGILTVTIHVVNHTDLTTPNNLLIKSIGCRFIDLDSKMDDFLQRYIIHKQSEAMV